MGLFEKFGRKVEEFKQQAESASHDQANRKCGDCGTLIYTERDDCPDCGSDDILVRKGWEPADGNGSDEGDAGGDSSEGDTSGETSDGGDRSEAE